MSRLLLLSNSTMPGTSFFTWPRPHVKNFLGKDIREVVFIPFAAVTLSFDAYEDAVSRAFEAMGYKVVSVHKVKDKVAAIRDARAIVVGGGNTFALVTRMHEAKLMKPVQEKAAANTPYVGWSAGANLACPTLKTTNDMPVVQPPSFDALNLVPFQINPHYHELKFQNQGGETRRERLEEFLLLNQTTKVIGLPEGMFIHREGRTLKIGGDGVAKLYVFGKAVVDLRPESDVSHLL